MEKIEKLLEEIDSLTVKELADLVKGIEEKYGVSAVAAAAPAAGAAVAGADEKSDCRKNTSPKKDKNKY